MSSIPEALLGTHSNGACIIPQQDDQRAGKSTFVNEMSATTESDTCILTVHYQNYEKRAILKFRLC